MSIAFVAVIWFSGVVLGILSSYLVSVKPLQQRYKVLLLSKLFQNEEQE